MTQTKLAFNQLVGSPSSTRDIIQYKDATSVYIHAKQAHMTGFRFHGNYYTEGPTYSYASTPASCTTASDLAFGMSSVVAENWYAVFACANNGDSTATLKIVPFLRADSVATSTITLRKAGEAVHASSPQTYTWAADALNNLSVLVISETVNARDNHFSGRLATITDSTTTTITLDTIGGIKANDWLLPAPNGFTYYRYCGAFYFDTAEVRDIADSGSLVVSRGIYDATSATNTGSVASPEKREVCGYISPLATGVIINSAWTLTTANTGNYAEYYDIDSSSHTVAQIYADKGDTGSDIRSYLKQGRLFSGNPGLQISTNFDVETANACEVSINSTIYSVSAGAVADTGTSATIAASKWGVFLVHSDVSGNLTTTWETNSGAGYDNEAAGAAARTGLESNKAPIGYVTVQASGSGFTAGTDALAGGTGGNPATTTNYYNSSNAANELTDSPSVTYQTDQILVPFTFGQYYYFSNAGTLAANRTGAQQNLWGWIEP
jgi:hypothetical protein